MSYLSPNKVCLTALICMNYKYLLGTILEASLRMATF